VGVPAEAILRQRVQELSKALRAKDLDGVMSFYAPDIVSFDLDPPLRYAGIDDKRRAWQEFFAHPGPVTYEVCELDVMVEGDLALVHSVNHVRGALWVRWTACFRRVAGLWLIVHDHVSVPADLARGQAVLDLQP
jgi:ketosteroid isomerase-like protein